MSGDDFEREIMRLAAAADRELASSLRQAVDRAATGAVNVAKGTRRYRNRTGELTRSIHGRVTKAGPLAAEGVFEATAEHASHVNDPTRPHEIRPRGGKALRFEGRGGTRFARAVSHPGTRGDGFFDRGEEAAERVLDEEGDATLERVGRILEG